MAPPRIEPLGVMPGTSIQSPPSRRADTPLGVISVRPCLQRSDAIVVALVDDYEIVLIGLAHMFDHYHDRIVVAEIDANKPIVDDVDIVLYDTFAQPEADHDEIDVLIDNPHARRVVVYTWNFHPDLIDSALAKGASGYLSKTLPARELVDAFEAIHAGEIVVSAPPPTPSPDGLDWPGRTEGLTDRESEILALITQGKSNHEVAALTYLSHQLDQDVHPLRLPQDRRDQPHPSRAVGHRTRLQRRTTAASTTGAGDPELLKRTTGRWLFGAPSRRGMTPSRSAPRSSAESDSSSTPSRWPTATWSSIRSRSGRRTRGRRRPATLYRFPPHWAFAEVTLSPRRWRGPVHHQCRRRLASARRAHRARRRRQRTPPSGGWQHPAAPRPRRGGPGRIGESATRVGQRELARDPLSGVSGARPRHRR